MKEYGDENDEVSTNKDFSDEKFEPNYELTEIESEDEKFVPNYELTELESEDEKFIPNYELTELESEDEKFVPNYDLTELESEDEKFVPNYELTELEIEDEKFVPNYELTELESEDEKFIPNYELEVNQDDFNPIKADIFSDNDDFDSNESDYGGENEDSSPNEVKEDLIKENIDSQNTVQILKNDDMEYHEQQEERRENKEDLIGVDIEEFAQEPIYDTDEINFIRDMEEIGRELKESEEKLSNSEENLENYDNTGFKAEQVYQELKEKGIGEEIDDKGQVLDEYELQPTYEQENDQYKDNFNDRESEEEYDETPEKIMDIEELEYLWKKYESLEEEGRDLEDIAKLMCEAEKTYKILKNFEEIYAQQEKEKVKSVNHENEEEPEDYREEIDRANEVAHLLDVEERQKEKEEQFEENGNDPLPSEIDKQQDNKQASVKVNHKNDQVEMYKLNLDMEQQEQIKQTSIYSKVENIEINPEVENREEIEDYDVESCLKRNDETNEKKIKSEKEESEEQEYEELQELYRMQTGKRPFYAGRETKGFSQWLERQDFTSIELEEEDEIEQEEEEWQKTLKTWIEESSEEEYNSKIKSILRDIVENYHIYEELEEKFSKMYEKYKNGELTDKEEKLLYSIINKLDNVNPAHLRLYLNISGFKAYFQEHHLWNPVLIEQIKCRFMTNLSHKYKILKRNEKESQMRKFYSSSLDKQMVWYENDGKAIIDDIILDNIYINTKIGRETYKAIKNLMKTLEKEKMYKLYTSEDIIKDEKGREYLSYNDPDFQTAFKLYKKGKKQYGGLLYTIRVMGNFYVGLTERRLKERFIEHIIDSMRYYVRAEGDINNPGYGKFQQAIVFVLENILGYDVEKLYEELKYLSYTNQYEKRWQSINEILDNIEPFIESRIIEIHYGTDKLGVREKHYTKNFPNMDLYGITGTVLGGIEIDFLDLKREGLNMVYGGGGSGFKTFPIYDIAIMIALGLSAPKISEILQKSYGIKYADTRSVQNKIADIFGGTYAAQELLLRPIMEQLLEIERINRHDIYLTFKNAEIMNAWFSEWSYGREVLKIEINEICEKFNLNPVHNWEIIEKLVNNRERYYAGIPESQWLDWIFHNVPRRTGGSTPNTIQDKIHLGDRKIKAILKVLCEKYNVNNKDELMYMLHREKAKEIISNGFIKKEEKNIPLTKENYFIKIYTDVFGFKDMYNAKYYFRDNLFRRMTLEEIWQSYHLSNKSI